METDELLAMIEYQGDISLKQVMTEAKLSEIVGDLQGLSSNERKTIEKHDNQLQQAIAKIVGNKDTADLGWRVLQLKKKDRDDVVMRVGAEFQSLLATALPRFDQSRLQEIVKTYVETMAAIATI